MRAENFNGTEIAVHETKDSKQWYMTVEEVAKGYGVATSTIRTHLKDHADEIREGIEKNTVGITDGNRGNPNKTVIYKEGVIKLGYFVRSKQAAMFRQWATNLIVAVMDQQGFSMQDMFKKLEDKMDANIADIKEVCTGLRDELDELKTLVQVLVTDQEAIDIRKLIVRVKVEKKLDGRAIVGHIRKTLQTHTIYDGPNTKQIINTLRNMLGEGVLGLVPKQVEE